MRPVDVHDYRFERTPKRDRHATRVWLAVGAALLSLVALAACSSTSSSSSSSYRPVISLDPASAVATATSVAADDDSSWRTISQTSVASVSLGGGSNSSNSQSSVSVRSAYRVLADCEGSGSLAITLNPGGSLTVHCTSDGSDPVRIAGSDSPPSGHSISVSVRPNGEIEDAEILVQERV